MVGSEMLDTGISKDYQIMTQKKMTGIHMEIRNDNQMGTVDRGMHALCGMWSE